jgi:hypothetical protein
MKILAACVVLSATQITTLLELGGNAYRSGRKCIVLDDPATKAFYEALGDRKDDLLNPVVYAWRAGWYEAWVDAGMKPPAGAPALRCDMTRDCTHPVTHIEEKGWAYCEIGANGRRSGGRYVRKLRPFEIERMRAGLQISYRLKPRRTYDLEGRVIAAQASVLRQYTAADAALAH